MKKGTWENSMMKEKEKIPKIKTKIKGSTSKKMMLKIMMKSRGKIKI